MKINFLSQTWDEIRDQTVDFIRERFPTYTDTAASDFGMMIVEVLAKFTRMMYYRMNFLATESFLPTATQRSSLLKFADQLGYTPKLPSAASADITFEKTNPAEPVTVPEATEISTADGSVTFVTVEQLNMPPGVTDDMVTAIHAEPHEGELLNYSTGEPNQEYRLSNSPLIERSDSHEVGLTVHVGGEEWAVVDGLVQHLGDEKVCELRIDEDQNAYLMFGNGTSGKIPPEGESIEVDYYTGGGKEGLVGPRSLVNTNAGGGIDSAYNERQATGGRARLSKEELRQNTKAQATTLERLVTKNDYKQLIQAEIPEVAQVTVQHPRDNLVNVYLMPHGGHPPSDDLLEEVQGFIDSHAIETDYAIARKPEGIRIDVEANLVLKEGYSAKVLQAQSANNPEGRGVLNDFREWLNRWKFNDEIYINDLYEWFEDRSVIKEATVTKLDRSGGEEIVDLKTDVDEVFAAGDIILSVMDE